MSAATSSTAASANRKHLLRRTATSTTVTDSEASAAVSPADSPRPSASSTSLSSLSSLDVDQAADSKKPNYANLIDTYGNEFSPPDYTIKQLRDAIPKHCFERSALTGYYYILRDMACLAATFYIFHNFVTEETIPSKPLRAGLWALYTVLQGLFGTGLWVIAHECGHGAFSESTLINDVTGWVLHSALFVPYFSWKFSHSAHHKATGHIERDMTWNPKTREEFAGRVGRLAHELHELTEETPINTMITLVSQQLLGWPMYLLTNVTSNNFHERQREGRGKGKKNGFFGGVNHFDPRSPIFDNKHAKYIVLSDIGVAIAGFGLYKLIQQFGFTNIAVWYLIPYLWVNHWLVAITYLQHTDGSLPHYTADEWNYVRGAAATIDREMGFIGRQLLHGIVETHVLHHYVSTIPFYHADEASEAIQKVMGKHYRSDTKDGVLGFLRSMWKSAKMCQWVEPSEKSEGAGRGVLFYRNRNHVGTPPTVIPAPQ